MTNILQVHTNHLVQGEVTILLMHSNGQHVTVTMFFHSRQGHLGYQQVVQVKESMKYVCIINYT